MSRAANGQKDARGFTLLELLVSMTVVSLLATTILFGWRIAASSWGRVNEMVDEQRRIEAVHRVLEEQMADMTPIAPWLRQGNTNTFFQGERETARFVSRYSLLHRGRSGLYRIEYHVSEYRNEDADAVKQLLLMETPLRGLEETAALLAGVEQSSFGTLLRFAAFERTPTTRVLLDGLEDCYFEYYRPAGAAESGAWVTQWMSRGSELPRAMAIRIGAEEKGSALRTVSVVATVQNYSRSVQ